MSGNVYLRWLTFTAAVVIIGWTWAVGVARYGGPDEPAHVIRAAAVGHGDLRGEVATGYEPGYRKVRVAAPLTTGDPACFRHSPTTTADCAVVSNPPGEIDVATSAGGAPPWYYLVVGVIVRVVSSGRTVLASRMAAVLWCAAILGLALLRAGRHARVWLLAAMTAPGWFLLGVVGTSGIEVALVLLALLEATRRFDRPAAVEWVTVPLAVCLVMRPAAAVDVVLVGLFLIGTVRPLDWRSGVRLALPLALAGSLTLWWNRWLDVPVTDRRTADSHPFATALNKSVHGIPTTIHQAIGALGWNEFFAPALAQASWLLALVVAVWWARSLRWHLLWASCGLVLPTIAELLVHRRIGEVWQGRYSIPFAIGGVLYAARVASPPRRLLRALLVSACIVEVATFHWTLRRYMVGMHGSLIMSDARWTPLVNAWLLIAVNAATMLWLVRLVCSDDRSDERSDERSDDVGEDVDQEVGAAGVVEHGQLPA